MFPGENLKERGRSEDLNVDGEIVLKVLLKVGWKIGCSLEKLDVDRR
jgi:hypothetical protein